LIDTVKIVLKHSCLMKDLQALLHRMDFKTTECNGSREVAHGQTVREYGRRTELYREPDGCRIRIYAERIEVEVASGCAVAVIGGRWGQRGGGTRVLALRSSGRMG
jgi:hypothetical protein